MNLFITGRNEVVAKVMLLHMSVHRGGLWNPPPPWDQREPPQTRQGELPLPGPGRHPPTTRENPLPLGPGRTPRDQENPPGPGRHPPGTRQKPPPGPGRHPLGPGRPPPGKKTAAYGQ